MIIQIPPMNLEKILLCALVAMASPAVNGADTASEGRHAYPTVEEEILVIDGDDGLIAEESEDVDSIEIVDDVDSTGDEDAIRIEEDAAGDDAGEAEILIGEEPTQDTLEGDAIVTDQDTDGGLQEAPELVIDEETALDISDDQELTEEADAEQPPDWSTLARYSQGNFSLGLDEARIEAGRLFNSDSDVDTSNYGHLAFSARWTPDPVWETQLSGRVDGYYQSGDPSTDKVEMDYGDSFIRYRAENYRVTAGTQTIIWGRIDEMTPTDRISRWDATRGVLGSLPQRRRALPVIRFESFHGDFKLDAVFLPVFRRANLPNKKNIWYPVNQETGKIIGVESTSLSRAFVRNGDISNRTPSGNGGFGVRLSHTGDLIDYALTVQRNRQSAPYYQFNPQVRSAFLSGADVNTAIASSSDATFQARYPRSWVLGGDLGFEALSATWRFEAVWLSDQPATRSDLRYTTTNNVNWAAGVQFHPGDGDVRVNLQLWGSNMINAPDVVDQENTYNFNGSVVGEFANNRWRAKTRFFIGVDQQDIYINPEIAFIGWEPQEIYLGVHYFKGNNGTVGGFYKDNSLVTLGWRAQF